MIPYDIIFFFSSRRRHTRLQGDWSSDVCSSDLRRLVPARVAVLVLVSEPDLLFAGSVQEHVTLLLRQLRPRLVHVDAEVFADRLEQLGIEELRLAPRRDRTLPERQRLIRYDQVSIDH